MPSLFQTAYCKYHIHRRITRTFHPKTVPKYPLCVIFWYRDRDVFFVFFFGGGGGGGCVTFGSRNIITVGNERPKNC